MIAGALLPLCDLLVNFMVADDRIEALSREPLFSAPLIGTAFIASLVMLTAFVAPMSTAIRFGLSLLAGYALFMLILFFTPVGVPIAFPFSEMHWSLPVFPIGHPPLLIFLLTATAVMAIWKGSRRWFRPFSLVMVGVYLLLGFGQYGVIAHQVGHLGTPGQKVHIYPDSPWMWRWRVVVESTEEYQLRRHHVLRDDFAEPRFIPRWNDQALFLKLLADPVVNEFYYRVFRHPVVQLDTSGSQITLLLQELEHQWPLVPGPTFYLESDLNGRNRLYQLQRFY